MSNPSAFGFSPLMPGFDFLQKLTQTASAPASAGGAIPGLSSWVAPTLSVEELDKRIQELKAVQFWLEQNGTALKATIQALEVQKMTLSTLQGMNVNMAELAKAFTAKAPEPAAAQAAQAAPAAAQAPTAASTAAPPPETPPETPAPEAPKAKRAGKAAGKPSGEGATVDPMQWWGSLTQQFQNIAASALQDVAAQALKAQVADPAKGTASTRSANNSKAAKRSAAKTAPKTAVKTARKTAATGKARASRP